MCSHRVGSAEPLATSSGRTRHALNDVAVVIDVVEDAGQNGLDSRRDGRLVPRLERPWSAPHQDDCSPRMKKSATPLSPPNGSRVHCSPISSRRQPSGPLTGIGTRCRETGSGWLSPVRSYRLTPLRLDHGVTRAGVAPHRDTHPARLARRGGAPCEWCGRPLYLDRKRNWDYEPERNALSGTLHGDHSKMSRADAIAWAGRSHYPTDCSTRPATSSGETAATTTWRPQVTAGERTRVSTPRN